MTHWPYPDDHFIGLPKATSSRYHSEGEAVETIRKLLGYSMIGPYSTTDAQIVASWHRDIGQGSSPNVSKEDWERLHQQFGHLLEEKPPPRKKTSRRKKGEDDESAE